MSDSFDASSPGPSEEENTTRPLDYTLPPLVEVLADIKARIVERLGWSVETTVYVWGAGDPAPDTGLERFQDTPAARSFAHRSGWDETKPGAWAKETSVSLESWEALQSLSPVFKSDPAVQGWGLQLGVRPEPPAR